MPAATFPTVLHLLRPAQGGMRELVRALLLAAPVGVPPLLCAPAETLEAFADAVPDSRRLPLPMLAAPHQQIAGGQVAARFAKKQGADLLHGHGLRFAPLFASASVASGLPLVVSLHNLVPPDMNGLQKAAAGAALSRATRIIAVSDAVAKSAATVAPASRIETIPNGIETARFAIADAAKREQVRESLGVVGDAPVIVCLSRLSPEKDVTNLLEAFALVLPDFPDARLFIAGDGKLRPTLQWHIELLGIGDSAHLLGSLHREAVADLLHASDIFALSSREEGLSLAVLEAMAAGLPVVATRVGGLPEAVAENVTGYLAPPQNPQAFAAQLTRLLGDTEARTRMGDAGRAHVRERFTQERMIAQTFGVYERAMRH
ncbi:MAG: glycosyltransferase family 4 protein [Armatimonadetes bacterium]|nr:glycosyltransferase family 4 protein [Armatimonadota bacterium]